MSKRRSSEVAVDCVIMWCQNGGMNVTFRCRCDSRLSFDPKRYTSPPIMLWNRLSICHDLRSVVANINLSDMSRMAIHTSGWKEKNVHWKISSPEHKCDHCDRNTWQDPNKTKYITSTYKQYFISNVSFCKFKKRSAKLHNLLLSTDLSASLVS